MRKKENILKLKTRRKIYHFISKYPGIHIRGISRGLKTPFSTLNYHLGYLEKHRLIIRKTESRYNRFYVIYQVGRNEKKILNFINQDTPRQIILLLFGYVECSLTEISENLDKNPSTILFYLKKLERVAIIQRVQIEKGLIDKHKFPIIKRNQVTNETIYMLKDPNIIYNLLITYKSNLIDETTIDIILDYVNDFLSDGVPKEILSPKSAVDSIAEVIYELFPQPYCA